MCTEDDKNWHLRAPCVLVPLPFLRAKRNIPKNRRMRVCTEDDENLHLHVTRVLVTIAFLCEEKLPCPKAGRCPAMVPVSVVCIPPCAPVQKRTLVTL